MYVHAYRLGTVGLFALSIMSVLIIKTHTWTTQDNGQFAASGVSGLHAPLSNRKGRFYFSSRMYICMYVDKIIKGNPLRLVQCCLKVKLGRGAYGKLRRAGTCMLHCTARSSERQR
ncbi:hypothetical protein K504DRAFT_272612 [Pleomassaria siparia CBS 279.74]|uniref:Uncharacterized protein n=1 Tax=Pleomassaria siparia CBS 279.74 TaxID=1314801 RepID=A0A6G1KA75_9PLEO|nr:hypothetical protein K504DRAFT_272612 [Pleomassaria siparia CBS 279.74]